MFCWSRWSSLKSCWTGSFAVSWIFPMECWVYVVPDYTFNSIISVVGHHDIFIFAVQFIIACLRNLCLSVGVIYLLFLSRCCPLFVVFMPLVMMVAWSSFSVCVTLVSSLSATCLTEFVATSVSFAIWSVCLTYVSSLPTTCSTESVATSS